MAAPKGNQFWKLRSKHGRDKLFATPKLLWEAACEYFEWVEKNPLQEQKSYHSNGVITYANEDRKRPYTIHALCLYLDCNVQYLTDFEKSLLGKKDKISQDFSVVITRIREIIYNQKFEGAASGFFNPNIIARDLGLAEKKEVKGDFEVKQEIDYSKLSDEALEEIINAASDAQDNSSEN